MGLVTLEEMKERLSVDFSTKDVEIQGLINSAEGYLEFATGINYNLISNNTIKDVAKEYIMLHVYLDYYLAYTEMDDMRLTRMMKQLQVYAMGLNYGTQSS